MQDQVPDQYYHYPLIAHHLHHHVLPLSFQVYSKAEVAKVAPEEEQEKNQDEPISSAKIIDASDTPNALANTKAAFYAFQFSAISYPEN